MQKYANTVVNRSGAAIYGASVTVLNAAGAVAVIYSDNGSTQKSNPMLTDANGSFEFYAANGVYSLSVDTGAEVRQHSGILLHDPGDATSSLSLADGATAPATLSGKASVYVDAADGDLKVKFGDGTVKTVATDT